MDICKKIWLGESSKYVNDTLEGLTSVQVVEGETPLNPDASVIFLKEADDVSVLLPASVDGHVLQIFKAEVASKAVDCQGLTVTFPIANTGCTLVYLKAEGGWVMVATNGAGAV